MQYDFMKTICQIGIFMICAQAIIHFRPKASYEKYLKMLVSAMILMQMFLFISSIFSDEGEQTLLERVRWFAESLEESMQEAAEATFFTEEEREFEIVGENPEWEDEKTKEELIEEIGVRITPIEAVEISTIP